MSKQAAKIAGLLAVMALLIAVPAFADENEVVSLKSEVNDLNSKVSQLQRQVQNMATNPPSQGSAYIPPSQTSGGLLHAAQDIQVSGYVDTSYSMALNNAQDHRTSGGVINNTNLGRTFDTQQDSFLVNAVELDLEKAANPEGGAGFRADIMYGHDAEIVDFDASTVASTANQDELDLQQAYVQYIQPLHMFDDNEVLPDSIDIKVGRFVTLAGLEVIESKDNWNMSRSFAFGLGLPFTHTGLRTQTKWFKDKVDLYLGVNNGWDFHEDNNRGKTAEIGLGYSPIEKVSLFHSIYFGPERNDQIGHKRFLITNVVSYDVTDHLSLKGEINYGTENRVGSVMGPTAAPVGGGENDHWQSYAGYARYAFNDKFGIAYRLELFRQDSLTRSTLDPTLFEQTITGEYLLATNLTGRLEYRWDKANNNNAFDLQSNQQTLGAELIYSFA